MVTNYATLYIKCTPDDDATVFDSSCTSRLKAANSKAALILPRRNMPRSPPFFAEPHSENFLASSWKSERRRCVGAVLRVVFFASMACGVDGVLLCVGSLNTRLGRSRVAARSSELTAEPTAEPRAHG